MRSPAHSIPFEFKKENITHIEGRYSWSPAGRDELRWQSIPRGTAIKIYKHYFADFGEFWLPITGCLLQS